MSQPESLRALDVFPDLSEELDRRISHSETRIKNWVLVGVASNILIALSAAIPVIWVSANISADIRGAMATQQAQAISIAANEKWKNDRLVWEAKMESEIDRMGGRVEMNSRWLGGPNP